MRIIKEWKQFREWKEYMDFYQEIDLTESEKIKLEALGEIITEKVLIKTKNHISNKVLSEELSVEYIKWAKYTLAYIKWIITNKK